MVAILCLAAFLDTVYVTPGGLAARPDPLPDRWLLKYAPRGLPKLPDLFFDTDWHYGNHPRSMRGAYDVWTRFGRESLTAPPEVTVIRSNFGFDEDGRAVTLRRVPLAVYGPLVEYDGSLHTVALTNWEVDPGKKPRWALNLGAAVEVRPNVWYQAGSERVLGGDQWVREYRLEFADDPRVKTEGRVKVFRFERLAHKFNGESVEADGEFVTNKPEVDRMRTAVIRFKDAGGGVKSVSFQLGGGYYPSVIDGISRSYPSVLTASQVPPPKVAKEPPAGLMQPPKKPQK